MKLSGMPSQPGLESTAPLSVRSETVHGTPLLWPSKCNLPGRLSRLDFRSAPLAPFVKADGFPLFPDCNGNNPHSAV